MFKLVKYEFKKQKFSKLVILCLAALIEIYFLYGFVIDSKNVIVKANGLLITLTVGALFFVSFESIFTYYNDLKQKCSYMLFLTPNSTFSIVGAKVVSAAITVFLTGLSFMTLFIVNGTMILAKNDQLNQIVEIVKQVIQEFANLDSFTLRTIIAACLMLLFNWISTVTLAFFAITLSSTFLADKKGKGFVSFLIFLVLSWLFNWMVTNVIGTTVTMDDTYFFMSCLSYLCLTVITYVGTAWMLDKKVSV